MSSLRSQLPPLQSIIKAMPGPIGKSEVISTELLVRAGRRTCLFPGGGCGLKVECETESWLTRELHKGRGNRIYGP